MSLEDSGNYSCEISAPLNSVLGLVTHYLFVRGQYSYDENLHRMHRIIHCNSLRHFSWSATVQPITHSLTHSSSALNNFGICLGTFNVFWWLIQSRTFEHKQMQYYCNIWSITGRALKFSSPAVYGVAVKTIRWRYCYIDWGILATARIKINQLSPCTYRS